MDGEERMDSHIYLAIDLKSFYASVECMERGLNPMTTNLVVADESRTEKTICLAVSPSLKAYGISGRARLFEVVQRVREVNAERRREAPGQVFTGSSYDDTKLKASSNLELSYIAAPPRMAHYIEYSSRIYQVYLKYVAPEDMHVYSIDEVFMDITHYLGACRLTSREFAKRILQDVENTTGITATAGIGENLYLCKAAMDIVAKHVMPDQDGVRIVELGERDYRRLLWTHRPLTDFWRVGAGYARKLEEHGMYTMGDVARCSIGRPEEYYNEDLLYKLFGINAEFLIDHAWGYEPCTIADIKAYKPKENSLCSGQVLQCPYDFEKTKLIVREMTDLMALSLVEKGLVTKQMVLTIGYDIENLTDPQRCRSYHGEVTTDRYGRKIPKHAHGTENLERYTSSARLLTDAVLKLYDRVVDPDLLVRRVTVTAARILEESAVREAKQEPVQLDLFTDYEALERKRQEEEQVLERENKMQRAVLEIKKKYGKNAILKGMNLEEGATTAKRNRQIGGHKA